MPITQGHRAVIDLVKRNSKSLSSGAGTLAATVVFASLPISAGGDWFVYTDNEIEVIATAAAAAFGVTWLAPKNKPAPTPAEKAARRRDRRKVRGNNRAG